MYMGLHSACKQVGIDPNTMRKMLPYFQYRKAKWKDGEHIEVNIKFLEKYCILWCLGPYGKKKKCNFSDEDYLLSSQAAIISGIPSKNIGMAILRGKVKGIKNPAGRWLVNMESLREWIKNRVVKRKSRKEKLNHTWLYPLTQEEIKLANRFWYYLLRVKEYATKKELVLEKDWIEKIIRYMHEKEKFDEECIQNIVDNI